MYYYAEPHAPIDHGSTGRIMAAVAFQGRNIQLLLFTLFINIPTRSSDCVERMVVDPINAVVQVAYAKGSIYEYTHVSRRAILTLMLIPTTSRGFWVNDNLRFYGSKAARLGTCRRLNALFAESMPIKHEPDYVTFKVAN